MNKLLLNKLESHQILLLVHGLLPIMLFREVSVNRRIYSWLLNINNTNANDTPPNASVSDISSIDQQSQPSDDIIVNNNSNLSEELLNDEGDIQILSQYSENIIVDAFTFYLDRINDINLIQLNSVDIDNIMINNHSLPSVHSTQSLHVVNIICRWLWNHQKKMYHGEVVIYMIQNNRYYLFLC